MFGLPALNPVQPGNPGAALCEMRDAIPLAGDGSVLSKLLILKSLAQEINKLVLTDITLSSIHMLMDVPAAW